MDSEQQYRAALWAQLQAGQWRAQWLETVKTQLAALRHGWTRARGWLQLQEMPQPLPPPADGENVACAEIPLPEMRSDRVLSLDLFDTCMVRRTVARRWAFDILGDAAFAAQREAVEQALRKAALSRGSAEDITLAEIYAELGRRNAWSAREQAWRQARELTIEDMLLLPVAAMREYAQRHIAAGGRLCYTTEMYLPAAALRRMLAARGFPAGEDVALFASGDCGLSKGTGNLYRKAVEWAQGAPLLHIGDNPESDIAVPSRLGIATHAVTVRREGAGWRDSLSAWLATQAETHADARAQRGVYWDAGFSLVGPLCLVWLNRLVQQAADDGVGQLWFLSRDGYLPLRMLRQLGAGWWPEANAHYLYASRRFWGMGSAACIDADYWAFLLKPAPGLTGLDILQRAGLERAASVRALAAAGIAPKAVLCHHAGYSEPDMADRLYAVLVGEIEAVEGQRKAISAALHGYLADCGLWDSSCGVVDLGWSGSLYRALQGCAPPTASLHAYYFALLEGAAPGLRACFNAEPESHAYRSALLRGGIGLLELLLSSGEPCVASMQQRTAGDWQPEWLPQTQVPPPQFAQWQRVSEGVDAFTRLAAEWFPCPVAADGAHYLERQLWQWIWDATPTVRAAFGGWTHNEAWHGGRRMRLLPRPAVFTAQPQNYELARHYSAWPAAFSSPQTCAQTGRPCPEA